MASFVATAPRWPAVIAHPLAAAFGLYFLLLILTALAAPGGELWMPAIGGVVSVGLAVVAFLTLRRRKLAAPGKAANAEWRHSRSRARGVTAASQPA